MIFAVGQIVMLLRNKRRVLRDMVMQRFRLRELRALKARRMRSLGFILGPWVRDGAPPNNIAVGQSPTATKARCMQKKSPPGFD